MCVCVWELHLHRITTLDRFASLPSWYAPVSGALFADVSRKRISLSVLSSLGNHLWPVTKYSRIWAKGQGQITKTRHAGQPASYVPGTCRCRPQHQPQYLVPSACTTTKLFYQQYVSRRIYDTLSEHRTHTKLLKSVTWPGSTSDFHWLKSVTLMASCSAHRKTFAAEVTGTFITHRISCPCSIRYGRRPPSSQCVLLQFCLPRRSSRRLIARIIATYRVAMFIWIALNTNGTSYLTVTITYLFYVWRAIFFGILINSNLISAWK